MNMSDYGAFILALLMLLINAFFVASEFALVKIRETRLEELSAKGHRLSRLALIMVRDLDNYLSATQLGITLASLALGYIGEPAFHWMMEPLFKHMSMLTAETQHTVSLTVSFIFFSAFHIILGELVPKSLAIQSTEKVLFAISIPMRLFFILCYPFMRVLQFASNIVLKLFRLEPVSKGHMISEAELKLIVEDTIESGSLEKSKQDLLSKVFQFSEKRVESIMVPLEKTYSLYLNKSVEENLRVVFDSQHTRYPIFEKTGGRLLGFIHTKDILWRSKSPQDIRWEELYRPLLTMRENKRIDMALRDFKMAKIHMAAVMNDQGHVLGFVTLEDVLEELVGNIRDEFDGEND